MAKVQVYTEGIRLDLFKDEGVNIKSRVQDINDISKVYSDFSKGFNVPASKVNNKYFEHYYNADITGGFDARTKKDAVIYIDDVFFRKGGVRLTNTTLKDNQISSYNIQFEGDTIKIKDILGDDKLNSLDFSDLDHDYNDVNVKQGVESSLIGGKVIYPLAGYQRRMFYNSSLLDSSNETNVNLFYNPLSTLDGLSWAEVKPAITVETIFEKIQDKYPLVFGGDIFNRDYLTKLYLFLNKDEGPIVTTGSETKTLFDWSTGSSQYIDFGTDTLTFTSTEPTTTFKVVINTAVGGAFAGVEHKIVIENFGNVVSQTNFLTGNNTTTAVFQVSSGGLDLSLKFYIISNNIMTVLAAIVQVEQDIPNSVNNTVTTFNGIGQIINPVIDMSYQMPDMKIIDFITGLIKMMNLVITSEDDVLELTTLDEWYKIGRVINISKYIETKKLDITRGKLKNEFIFKYENPETLLAEKFKRNNGVSYGDLEAKIFDSNGDLLDGGKLEVKVPFENMVYERIIDLSTGDLTDIQYGYIVDKGLESIVTKPMLFYNTNVDVSLTPIGFRDALSAQTIINNINVPNTCLSLLDNTKQTLNFGAEFSTYNYGIMEQSLYNSFYVDYVTDMFSSQRRVYKFKAHLPSELLSSIKLNDRLIIGNRRYIINSFDLNLTTGLTKFELLNDIYEAGDLIGDSFLISRQAAVVPGLENTLDILVTSTAEVNVNMMDTGDGVFVSSSIPKVTGIQTAKLTVDKNETGVARTQTVRFQRAFDFLDLIITQQPLLVKASSDIITADSDKITADNG